MITEKIKAHEITLKDLFGDKYIFEIPNFQRPFAWEKENFEQLFTDIKDALDLNKENYGDKIEDYEPYFLGSVILWTKDLKDDGSGVYAVIDGQQRLVSLAILIAVMRDYAIKVADETSDEKLKETFKDYVYDLQFSIYQKASKAKGTPESVRIKMREKEAEFFKKYILTEGGTNRVNDIDKKSLTGPKLHMLEAIEVFKNGFKTKNGEIDKELLDKYIRYLLQKVILVVIKTGELASAFRLFNIINARGMPLTNADLLKSENLSVIPKEEEPKYTKIWEDLEEDFGSEKLEMLISFIRSIKLKEKARKSIYEEFEDKVFKKEPEFKGKKFIEYLQNIANIYGEKIEEARITTENSEEEIYYYNLISLMRDFLPFNDWMVGVIKFKEKFKEDSHLFQFLRVFEKKITIDWITGLSFTERLTQIYKIVKLIEESNSADDVINNPIFNVDLKRKEEELRKALDDLNFYGKGRTRVPKYVLLRIDMERSYNQNKKISYSGEITVEHILPRTPKEGYWLSRFSEEDRLKWTNRLGNLVLLNSRKNSQAGNKPFPEKIRDYFEKKSDFDITNELKSYKEWNVDKLKERHNKLLQEAVKIWIPT